MGRRERTRERLLTAARNVFASRGYHAAKIEDIAAAGKVAKGTFYLHFKDKRAVFVELVDDVFDRLRRAILRVDVKADVAALVQAFYRHFQSGFLRMPERRRKK